MSQFTLTLDSSQIYEIQTCPLKWYYHYVENLVLAGADFSAPDKGTLIHLLCDKYYNELWKNPGTNKLLVANTVIDEFRIQGETQKLFPTDTAHELEDFLCNRFLLYVNRYFINDFVLPFTQKEFNSNGPVEAVSPVELGFSKLLFEDEDFKFIVEGRIDLINIINGDTFCWVDHKTQSRDNQLYKYKPQFKTYAWATGYEYGLINYIGLQEDKSNALLKKGSLFKRELIHFPKEMISEWEGKMLEIFFQVSSMIKEPENAEGICYNLRNDSMCSGAFDSNPCQFTHICEEFNWDLKQRIKEFKYIKKEPWTPWEIKK